MDYRQFGHSGFKVPALGFGGGTFGDNKDPPLSALGNTDAAARPGPMVAGCTIRGLWAASG